MADKIKTNIYRYLKKHFVGFVMVVVVLYLAGCEWSFNPDESTRSVVIFYPADGAYPTEADTIKVEAVDNDAVESVTLLIDGRKIDLDFLTRKGDPAIQIVRFT